MYMMYPLYEKRIAPFCFFRAGVDANSCEQIGYICFFGGLSCTKHGIQPPRDIQVGVSRATAASLVEVG